MPLINKMLMSFNAKILCFLNKPLCCATRLL